MFLSMTSSSLFAIEYYQFMYKFEDGETFSDVLKKFVYDDAIINANTPLVKKNFKINTKIKDWEKIDKDSIIELFISKDMMDLSKYTPYQEVVLKSLEKEEELKLQKTAYPEGLKGSIYYMSSLGSFTQSADNVAEIEFKQNSPVSLGTSFSYYPKDKLYSTSVSAYYSYLLASVSSITSDNVTIPPEIGGNLYGEYRYEKWNSLFYAGPDFEKFSVFNLRGLQNDKKIYVDSISAFYLTLGLAKTIKIFDKQLYSKLSLSKSIQTSYTNNAPRSLIDASEFVDEGKYNGMRVLFYLNYKITDKYYLHSLFKYHSMTGPSDLTTLRIGLGVGYILF